MLRRKWEVLLVFSEKDLVMALSASGMALKLPCVGSKGDVGREGIDVGEQDGVAQGDIVGLCCQGSLDRLIPFYMIVLSRKSTF